MNKRDFLKIFGVSVLAGSAGSLINKKEVSETAPEDKETALERITRTGKIRCAYASYNPMLIIDPNTGQKSGIFFDLINEIGKRVGLDVDWSEEVGYGNINQGFVTGRYEIFGGGLWPSGNRARNTIFSEALFYDPISVFVRANDTRFDGDLKKLNNPKYKVTYTDADATQHMAGALFPMAKPIVTTSLQGIAEEMQNVVSGKADATFRDLITVEEYAKHNPNTLKNISPDKPVFMYPLTIGFNEGEYGLKTLFDTVIFEMKDDGTIANTIQKYMNERSHLFFYEKIEYKEF